MHVVVDANIPYAEHYFGAHASIEKVAGREMTNADLKHADALIVRSITKVDGELLANSKVQFVGSCTIGIDHIDSAYLHKHDIGFASAPACNADAAAQFTTAALLSEAFEIAENPDFVVAIIGCGNVGSRLKLILDAVGIQNIVCDPFIKPQGFQTVSLDRALAADAISLHTPLTNLTKNMLGSAQLARLKNHAVVINTARGAIIQAAALLANIEAKNLRVFLDVWPQEPVIADELLAACHGSPHVAGYSVDGKVRGTKMVYAKFCEFFKLPQKAPPPSLGDVGTAAIHGASDALAALKMFVQSNIDLPRDDQNMQRLRGQSAADKALIFDGLRRDYPPRREWSAYKLSAPNWPKLQALFAANPLDR